MNGVSGVLVILSVLLVIALWVLWVLLPFLIMGANKRLDRPTLRLNESIGLQEKTAAYIAKLAGDAELSGLTLDHQP